MALPIGHAINVAVHALWPEREHIIDLIQRVLAKTYDDDEIDRLLYTGREITIETIGVGVTDEDCEGMFGWTDDVTTVLWRIVEMDASRAVIRVQLD